MTALPNSGASSIQFFDPKAQAEVNRRRMMAQMMMKQGQQPDRTEVISGVAVKQSPLAAMARAIQQGIGGYQAGQAENIEAQDTQKRQELLARAITGLKDDPTGSAQMLLGNPSTSDMGLKLYLGQIEADALKAQTQQKYAREDMNWERDANLKRELKAMGDGPGGITFNEDTGQLEIVEPQVENPAAIANAMGMPYTPLNTSGMSQKDASTYVKNTRNQSEKKLNDPEFSLAGQKARNNISDADRFANLMKEQPTGGWRNLPGIRQYMETFDDQASEMKSIQDRLTPQQRTPGAGGSSDFDARMFQSALPSFNKPGKTNENVIAAIKAREQDVSNYQSFLQDYFAANGHINSADKKWMEYVNANPIFDPTSPGDLKLNEKRQDYKTYFGAQAQQQPTPPAPTQPNMSPPIGGQLGGMQVPQLNPGNLDGPVITPGMNSTGLGNVDDAVPPLGDNAQEIRNMQPIQPPQPGSVVDGYRFRGGNPADPSSWEPVQ